MTLEEAIEMHERRIKFAHVCVCGDCPINECIKEHQLHIEWLKELKAYWKTRIGENFQKKDIQKMISKNYMRR